MITKEDKVYLINYKLDFWRQRLQESIDAASFLENNGNRVKIDMNNQDITDYSNMITSLENILDDLNA